MVARLRQDFMPMRLPTVLSRAIPALAAASVLCALTACASRDNYPHLVPADTILKSDQPQSPSPAPEIEARAAALRAQAAAIRAEKP